MNAPQNDPPVSVHVETQGVMISQREVYDKIVAIEIAVTGLPGRVEKLENRVDQLRQKVWTATGAAAAIGTASGLLISRALGL